MRTDIFKNENEKNFTLVDSPENAVFRPCIRLERSEIRLKQGLIFTK